MLAIAVVVDLAGPLDRTTTELGQMRTQAFGLLPEACHLNAGVR